MKKTMLLLSLILSIYLVNESRGTIAVNWISTYGIDDPTIPGVTYDLPLNSLIQLIWTPDNIIDPIDPFNPTVPQGNDKLLDQRFTTIVGGFFEGGTYPESIVGVPESVFLAGYIYVRVFNSPTPTIGDWYGESALEFPLNDQDPIPNPPNTVDIAPIELYTLPYQIVPEPATLAMLAISGAVIAMRRKICV